jgi:hypothetical protein
MFTSWIGLAPEFLAGGALRKRIPSAACWTLGACVLSLVLLGSLSTAGASAKTASGQLSSGGCGVHPTYAGQALLAQALLKSIRL